MRRAAVSVGIARRAHARDPPPKRFSLQSNRKNLYLADRVLVIFPDPSRGVRAADSSGILEIFEGADLI
jgi:hypothetical protein